MSLKSLFLTAGQYEAPFFCLKQCPQKGWFSVVCPLWCRGVSAMQGARRSALYFTCQCLTPFLLLWLQASVTEVYHMETRASARTDYSAATIRYFSKGGEGLGGEEGTVNEAENIYVLHRTVCAPNILYFHLLLPPYRQQIHIRIHPSSSHHVMAQ